MSVYSTQSLTVTIFEFDWKPRWVMIISENCSATSTLDISSDEEVRVIPNAIAVPG